MPTFADVSQEKYLHASYFVPQALLRGGIDKVPAAIEVVAVAAPTDG